ncbi:hypothetical protein ACSBR1_040544 [Camellia fascicularis]
MAQKTPAVKYIGSKGIDRRYDNWLDSGIHRRFPHHIFAHFHFHFLTRLFAALISKTTLTTPLNSARHREEDKGRFALNTSHLGHLSLFLSLSLSHTQRFVKEIELGRVELQSYSDESSLGWEAESKRNQTSFGSAEKTKHGELERKKGTPWTEEEHKYIFWVV